MDEIMETAPDTAPAPPPVIALPPVLDHRTSWICGPAGTGKTTLAKAIVTQRPGVALTATTGIAAVNLASDGVPATTIHSFLKFGTFEQALENYQRGQMLNVLVQHYRAGIRQILLDEVSMLDGRLLDVLHTVLKNLGGEGLFDVTAMDEIHTQMREEGRDPQTDLPIRLCLIGDFAQLPPVKAPFAFTAQAWEEYGTHAHKLTKIHRQADPDFLRALAAARSGDAGLVTRYFGSRMTPSVDPNFAGTTLFGRNDAVQQYNDQRLRALPGTPVGYPTTWWGDEDREWRRVIPDVLQLKPGALVMNLRNLRVEGTSEIICANGDLGTVETCEPERGRVWITVLRTGRSVMIEYITLEHTRELTSERRQQLRGEIDAGRVRVDDRGHEIIGTCRFLPLRLAYATTVHKSQGLTVDRLQINLNDPMFVHPGMLYVALSRVRTPEGLRLVGWPARLKACTTIHRQILPWI